MDRFDRRRQALAISLAGLSGFVDATGFLSADRYFVSFMSGNTTRLGVELAQDWRHAATPVLLIAGFVVGVAAGSVMAVRSGRWRKPAVLLLVTGLLLCAALTAPAGLHATALAMMVLAMGALNNTFQRNGQIAVGLTYMTGALVRLGQAIGATFAGERQDGWQGYLMLWLGLASGAVLGALAFRNMTDACLWIAFAASLTLASVAWNLARRENQL
ncbi:MAG TPA: YoaK family protein [Novosphingobium sp.]